MRTAVWCIATALLVIACHPSQPQRPAAKPAAIELAPELEERLALGLPLHVQLQGDAKPIGECTLVYDLWEERYKVAVASRDFAYATDAKAALRRCVDPDKVGTFATLRVRELPHVYQPRTDYPVF